MSSTSQITDPWKEVFSDKNGVLRCSRCKHARPSTYQQLTSTVQNNSNQRNNIN